MPYVQRNQSAEISGLFRWPVPGIAEKDQEFLADNHPEVVNYKAPLLEVDRVETTLKDDPLFRRLIAVLADEFGKTPRQIMDAMRAKS